MKWLKFGCKLPSKWLSFQCHSTSGPVIHFTGRTHCPVQTSLSSGHAVPLAIKQLVAHLPNFAVGPQVQDHFPITQVVRGFLPGREVQLGQC